MLFAELDFLSDVFCLCAANTRLMILGERRLRELMPASRWNGDKLICLGHKTEADDYPEGVLDAVQEYHNYQTTYGPTKFFSWTYDTFRFADIHFLVSHRHVLMKNIRDFDSRRHFLDPRHHIYYDFCSRLTEDTRVCIKSDILWNLSKKVYVRSDVVLELFDGVNWKVDKDQLIGTVLHIQICWSSTADTSMTYKGLHRGRWAGDRFEFSDKAGLDARLKEEGGEQWRDVSEEAVGLFVDVYKTQYGEDWRNKMHTMYRW